MLIVIRVTTLATLFFTIPLSKNPLSLLLLIIIIRLTIAVIFRIILSSWYSFLIFLIYVRGILVIFAYFATLTPNQPISIKSTLLSLCCVAIPMFSFTAIKTVNYPVFTDKEIQIAKIYELENGPTLLLITVILLFTMIVIVKLTKHCQGPLRPFIYVSTLTKNTSSYQDFK